MRDNFEKLNQLLEQEQCEFTGIPDGFAVGFDETALCNLLWRQFP